MNRREMIAMIGLTAVPGESFSAAEAAVKDRFIGVWELLSCERKFHDGRLEYPYGDQPVGRITYDKAGRMSAQLMRPGREAAGGYMAYFGRFDVDEASTTDIHHVQACLVPAWVGTDLKRTYRFDANRLHLTAASSDSTLELIWEKQPD
jgi:hypothetical protein